MNKDTYMNEFIEISDDFFQEILDGIDTGIGLEDQFISINGCDYHFIAINDDNWHDDVENEYQYKNDLCQIVSYNDKNEEIKVYNAFVRQTTQRSGRYYRCSDDIDSFRLNPEYLPQNQ